MRVLLLLLIVGVAAYFTVPTRAAHEEAARAYLEGMAQAPPEAQQQSGFSLDTVVDYVTGMLAGQGRYETFYVMSKYTVDMPGVAYVECLGAFTLVQCREIDRGAGQG